MFIITFFNYYTKQWQTEYARCFETKPKLWSDGVMELSLAQGVFNRDDSRTIFYTENTVAVSQQDILEMR